MRSLISSLCTIGYWTIYFGIDNLDGMNMICKLMFCYTLRKYVTTKQKCPAIPFNFRKIMWAAVRWDKRLLQKTISSTATSTGICTYSFLHWLTKCQNIWTPEFPALWCMLNLESFLRTQCQYLLKSTKHLGLCSRDKKWSIIWRWSLFFNIIFLSIS